MSRLLLDGRRVRVVIRNVGITAATAIDARRMADAIAPSLERAFAQLRGDAPPQSTRCQRSVDRVASQVTNAVAGRLREVS